MEAVRRACRDYGVPLICYPVEKMTLQDLTHTALGLHRFTNRLLQNIAKPGPVPPAGIRILPCAISEAGESQKFVSLELMSGGRYLATADDVALIQLWDLGHSPNTLLRRTCVASMRLSDFADTLTNIIHCQVHPDGKQIIILVQAQTGPQ
jgi:hypothetical protein